MITVRCPACGKVMGFEESDAGSLIACPLCRQSFFIPAIARPVVVEPTSPAGPVAAPPVTVPPIAPPLPLEPSLPDDIGIVADPDLDHTPEVLDEVLPAEDEQPTSEAAQQCDEVQTVEEGPPPSGGIPQLTLDAPPLPSAPPDEAVAPPAEVKPTDLAPSLQAAAVLSEALPPAVTGPDKPLDVLDEVDDERRRRAEKDEEDEEREKRPRRRPKKRAPYYPTPFYARPTPPGWWTRDRVMGAVGVGLGTILLMGTCTHHLTRAATDVPWVAVIIDLLGLVLVLVGLFYLFLKG
jgi:hypothetical protein